MFFRYLFAEKTKPATHHQAPSKTTVQNAKSASLHLAGFPEPGPNHEFPVGDTGQVETKSSKNHAKYQIV